MNSTPKVSFIKDFCSEFNVNELWFLKGTGEPFPGAYQCYREVCGPEMPSPAALYIKEAAAAFAQNAPGARQAPVGPEIRISEALTMTARVLESGTPYAIALYLNIQQFAGAIDALKEIKVCQESIADLQAQMDALRREINKSTGCFFCFFRSAGRCFGKRGNVIFL